MDLGCSVNGENRETIWTHNGIVVGECELSSVVEFYCFFPVHPVLSLGVVFTIKDFGGGTLQ